MNLATCPYHYMSVPGDRAKVAVNTLTFNFMDIVGLKSQA